MIDFAALSYAHSTGHIVVVMLGDDVIFVLTSALMRCPVASG